MMIFLKKENPLERNTPQTKRTNENSFDHPEGNAPSGANCSIKRVIRPESMQRAGAWLEEASLSLHYAPGVWQERRPENTGNPLHLDEILEDTPLKKWNHRVLQTL